VVEIVTEAGPAEVSLDGDLVRARTLAVLTHGAGGGVGSPDLLAVRDVCISLGGVVARVLQPYRVRGARAPGSAERQDAAWLEIVAALLDRSGEVPLVQGGRSNGARVACRTAALAGARAVVVLAFPLHPPGKPENSRAGELLLASSAGIPVLAISGASDPFGVPGKADADRVVVLPGETHALRGHAAGIRSAVADWLPIALALPA
jgi:predicted alpha/beta-hydrolase family hydrolase